MRRQTLALLGLLMTVSCGRSVSSVRDTEHAVLRALLDSSYGNDSLRGVLVRERFASFALNAKWERWLADSVPELPRAAVEDFKRVGTDSSAIPPMSVGRGRLEIVPESALQNIFRPGPGADGWVMLRARYPDAGTGLISLTRVGLSPDERWAITYIDSQADWLAGSGYLVVLHQDKGVWRPVKRATLRIS